MRKGKEYYARFYDQVIALHKSGLSVREIADKLDISYSAVYHWVTGLRSPEKGNVSEFVSLLEKGPVPVADIKSTFPKHNELFLIAVKRGIPVKRFMLKKKYGDYSTWYYMAGQEKQLEERTDELMAVIKKIGERLSE
ncbi:helix-turn-helix domain-containing protein [archaeon]|nr:helix-turn-helix domain-containing protein [archaeon]